MLTYADTLGKHSIALPDELIADVEVPVLTGPQCQGDVGVFPESPPAELMWMPVPAVGLPIVQGTNTHILDAYQGVVEWGGVAARAGDPIVGWLRVADGAVAYLTHTDEHTTNGIGPGTYRVAGKREQADEIRRVAD